jgi:hypothetical protein
MTIENTFTSPSTPSFTKPMDNKFQEIRAIQHNEVVNECHQSFSISSSPPRLSRKRKSCHNEYLVIPAKFSKLRPSFSLPNLYEIDSKKEVRKTRSTKFKLYPRRRIIPSPPRLSRKKKSCLNDYLDIPKLCPTFSVLNLNEIDSKIEERKSPSIEFDLYLRQRTTQPHLKALMEDIHRCIL